MGTIGLGKREVEICEHSMRDLGGKPAASLLVQDDDGNTGEVLVFFTPKSARIARAQLKRCGFDVDAHSLNELNENRTLLAGQRITINGEMYNGRVSLKIDMQSAPPKAAMDAATAMLRDAKKADDTFVDGDIPAPDDDDAPFS